MAIILLVDFFIKGTSSITSGVFPLFEINITIDGFPSGNLLVGKSKTYTVNLADDAGKRIKVKVEYQDPDYIDPKAITYVTKQKLECGKSDSVFVAFSK